jgi:DNA repair protein RadC
MAKAVTKKQTVDDPVAQRLLQIPLYRIEMVREGGFPVERKRVGSPQDVFEALHGFLERMDREYFLTLMLNTKNTVVGANITSIGTLNSSLVHPREVFKAAILANSAAVILVHFHPSGDPQPSPEDIEITGRLVEAGKVLGIEVLDHVIIGDHWVSLKERGCIVQPGVLPPGFKRGR